VPQRARAAAGGEGERGVERLRNATAPCQAVHGPRASEDYSGWNRASVLPSGSLNHADLPMPGLVMT